MSYGSYRRNDLAYGDDYPSERWDRERFERQKTQARGPVERETYSREPDRNTRGGERREVIVDERVERRGSGGRYDDRDRFYEEERAPPRRREYIDEDPRRGGAELAPYRQQKWPAAEYDIPIRAAARPTYRRRQSSLDTYDRRPVPRYNEDDRAPPSPGRYREVIRYRDARPVEEEREENYREVRIRRDGERTTRRTTRVEESSDSFEEVLPPSPPVRSAKRGRTKFPKRLTERRAIIDFGYPFEEEEDFYLVRTALGKDQIDEVISRSERYRDAALPKAIEAPPPFEPEPIFYPPPIQPVPEIIQTRTTVIENPTPEDYEKFGIEKEKEKSSESSSSSESEDAKSVMSKKSKKNTRSRRARSSHRTIEEDEESIGGPLAVIVPDRRRKSERDIQAEIRALEAEKRALKLEREAEQRRAKADKIRESEYEVVDSRRDRNVVRVEKDRRGKSRRAPNSRAVDAALYTLT